MQGIKLGFNLAQYAKQHGMGIGSFRLKDGSSIKILNGITKDATDFYQVKNGYLLGASGFRGEKTMRDAASKLCQLSEQAENMNEALNAWERSFEVIG